MITLHHLTKKYGDTTAVDELTLEVRRGQVTGFLGPNGAGKSTTMRMILGLDRPSAGYALVDGQRYEDLRHPARHVGALLDAKALHPQRTARNHLRALARSNGIAVTRVDQVLDQVGLAEVARRKAGQFSLGMGQRLGIAAALLGDPELLMFDEPVNGLDPEGVLWVRNLMRSLAAEGRTVFVSSHLMSEMQLTADHLVVIGKGRLIADAPTHEVIAGSAGRGVTVRVARQVDAQRLRDALSRDHRVSVTGEELDLVVSGAAVEQVGDLAHELGIGLHRLQSDEVSLEQAYMELTADSIQFRADSTLSDSAVSDTTPASVTAFDSGDLR